MSGPETQFDHLMRYKLLEYSTCTELGAKGLEQLNRLAIASLIFNGTLAAALGFATEQITSRTPNAATVVSDTMLAVGLLALLTVAVVFNLGAMASNINFWKMLEAISARHVVVDREITHMLTDFAGSEATDPKTQRLSDEVYRTVFAYSENFWVRIVTKSVFQTRNLTIAFYSLIIFGWVSYISALLYGLESPLAYKFLEYVPIVEIFGLG
ncbi:hypothetical protein [Nisaea sp.]|uniref:hypothetical protein n=1 Tax=Nisaea sp. TaxID=2024842 RepID=UPI003B517C3B